MRKGGATLGELLANEPGVAESSFASGASRPIIRGLDNFRVRLQENGVGAHDVSDVSEDHGTPLDPLAAQSIEVIRGPATLRYGSQAIGGVVSLHNNRIPTRVPEKFVDAELLGAFNSHNEGYEGAGLVDFGAGNFAGHAEAFYRDTDDYSIPGDVDEQANTFNETLGVSGGGSIVGSQGHFGVAVAYFESEYGIPGEAAADGVFIDLEQLKFQSSGEIRDPIGGLKALRFEGGYSDYTHDEVEGATGDIGSTFDNEEYEVRTEAVHADIGRFEGALGFQFARRELEAAGEASELISPSDRTSFAGFIFEEMKVTDRLRFQFAGRVEHVNLEGFGVTPPGLNGSIVGGEIDDFGADSDLDFTPLSGSAGLVFDLDGEIALGFSVQRVQRAPALLELFSKGPHEATATFEVGDPNLDKESAVSFEGTLKKDEGDFTFGLALFQTMFDGYIFKQPTGFVCGEEFDTCGIEGAPGVEDELQQIAFVQRDAKFTGFEAQSAWHFAEFAGGDVGVDGRFDFVRAKIKGGDNLPRITPMRYGAGLFYESDQMFARISALRVNRQDQVASFESETKGYTDLRIEATYAFGTGEEGSPTAMIGVSGQNLLNEDRRNHLSFLKDDVLLPGASARVFFRVVF